MKKDRFIKGMAFVLILSMGALACKKSNSGLSTDTVVNFNIIVSGDSTVGASVDFTTGIASTLPVTYLWDFGDGTTSTKSRESHSYLFSNTYAVTLTINKDTIRRKSLNIFIKPNYSFSTTGISIPGDSILFSLKHVQRKGSIYLWDFGDGNTSTDSLAYHIYTTAGTYNVSLAVNNDLSYRANATFKVVNDPIYTHMAGGMRRWHRQEQITFPSKSSYTLPDTSFEIGYVDPLTINFRNQRYTYNPDSSYGNTLYFVSFSGHIAYDHVLDTMSLIFRWGVQPPPPATGGHPPEIDYYDAWRTP